MTSAAIPFDYHAAVLADAKAKLRMIRDEPRFELLLPSEADEVLRALDKLEERRTGRVVDLYRPWHTLLIGGGRAR